MTFESIKFYLLLGKREIFLQLTGESELNQNFLNKEKACFNEAHNERIVNISVTTAVFIMLLPRIRSWIYKRIFRQTTCIVLQLEHSYCMQIYLRNAEHKCTY